MSALDIFKHRQVICVVVQVASRDRRKLNVLAPLFSTQIGTRGELLKRHAGRYGNTSMHVYPEISTIYGAVDADGYRRLQQHPEVVSIQPSGRFDLVRPVGVEWNPNPVNPKPGPEWTLRKLRIPELWAKGIKGRGVLIGHLDNGIDAKHPAIAPALEDRTFIDNAGVPGAASKTPVAGHGTHTAGTLIGQDHGGIQLGVAPNARLVSACVINGGDSIMPVIGGIRWALKHKVRVLNISIGQDGYNPGYEHIFEEVRAEGCLPVCASGNTTEGYTICPGNYANVLSVGAVSKEDKVAGFSGSEMMNRAVDRQVPDLIAPGVAVPSSVPGGGYAESSGTSMAAPHIAGLAALLFGAFPHATPTQVEAAILDSCVRSPWHQETRAGRGIPNALRAYELLAQRI